MVDWETERLVHKNGSFGIKTEEKKILFERYIEGL